jgi:hypothetical protein
MYEQESAFKLQPNDATVLSDLCQQAAEVMSSVHHSSAQQGNHFGEYLRLHTRMLIFEHTVAHSRSFAVSLDT